MRQSVCDYCRAVIRDNDPPNHTVVKILSGKISEIPYAFGTEIDVCSECAYRVGDPVKTFKRGMAEAEREDQK